MMAYFGQQLWMHLGREGRLMQRRLADSLLPTAFWWLLLGLQAFLLSGWDIPSSIAGLLPGLLLWGNLLLTTLLAGDRLWRVDSANDSLNFWRQSGCRLSLLLLAKLLALWGLLLINLLLLSPLLLLAFPIGHQPLGLMAVMGLAASLIIGSLGLAALCSMVSALLLGLEQDGAGAAEGGGGGTGLLGLLVLLPLAVPLLIGGMAVWATLIDTSNSPAAMVQSLAWQLALSVLYLVVVPLVGGQWLTLSDDG